MRPAFFDSTARALIRCLFDTGRGVPEPRVDWAIQDVDDFTVRAGIKTRLAFLFTLAVIEFLMPAWRLGRLTRFSMLSGHDKVRVLDGIENSFLAVVLVLPKAMLAIVYLEHPDALREVGFDGLPLRPASEDSP